ncbi:MAG TPA: O-antigen ligase family protein [Gemmatimonadales bacterium]|nr:O-antigen ligase family protein [Gemmatimonadales bacterium]
MDTQGRPAAAGAVALAGWNGGRAAVLAGAAACAVALGYLVAIAPGLLHFEPSTLDVAMLVAVLGFGAVVVWRPALALVALIIVAYLNLSDILIRWHGAPSVLQALAVPLLLAAWLVQRRRGFGGPLPGALTLCLAAYAVIVWLSIAWARDTALGEQQALAITKAFVIYALILLLTGSPKELRQGAWTLLGAAAFVGGLGVFQVLAGTYDQTFAGLARVEYAHIYGRVFEPRIAGPVGDPNFFAQMLIPAVPIGLLLAHSAASVREKVAAFGSVGVVTAAVVMTYSRGGALALGVVLALWLLGQGVSARRLAVGAGAIALLILLLPSDFARRLTTFRQFLPGSGDVLRLDSSFEQRRVLAATAWHMFLDRPLTGVGAGNYTVHYRPYTEETGSVVLEYDEFDRPHYPHNLYLEIAAETGLPGLIAFAAVLVTCFVYLRRARLGFGGAGDWSSASLATGVQLALIGYLVSSLFLHGDFPRSLWLLFGFCAALCHLAPTRPETRMTAPEAT